VASDVTSSSSTPRASTKASRTLSKISSLLGMILQTSNEMMDVVDSRQ
jgi:hypothetical protein